MSGRVHPWRAIYYPEGVNQAACRVLLWATIHCSIQKSRISESVAIHGLLLTGKFGSFGRIWARPIATNFTNSPQISPYPEYLKKAGKPGDNDRKDGGGTFVPQD